MRFDAFREQFNQIELFRYKSHESLDPDRFKTHFRVHGVLKIKIWMIDEEEIDA